MLKLRGTSALRVLYIGKATDLDTSPGAVPPGLVSEWIVIPTLSEALARISTEPKLCFNLNLIIFHITPLAAEPHLAIKLLGFAPIATRVLMYESPTERAVMEMSPLFDMSWARPDNRRLRPAELYWCRAGMAGSINAFEELPTAFIYVHRSTEYVLCANHAALELLNKPGFDGGPLSALIELPAEAFQEEHWRGDISLFDEKNQVLGVSVRAMEKTWLFVSLRDITTIHADREQRRQDDGRMILGRAAAVLAHEVSNPLAAIKSTLQLLGGMGGELTKSEIHDYVGRALREIERLSAIVKSYLSIVRPPAKIDEAISLKELVESAFTYLDDYLKTIGIRSEIMPIDPVIQVYFGTDQFKQIVWNIGKNAVDAMLKSRIKDPMLRVSWHLVDNSTVAVYFDDNGEGIDEALAEKIFEPYYTSKGSSGTGLGLTICRLLASRFQGDLVLRNNELGGARAILSLRLAKP